MLFLVEVKIILGGLSMSFLVEVKKKKKKSFPVFWQKLKESRTPCVVYDRS